jgi:hypothetical protein
MDVLKVHKAEWIPGIEDRCDAQALKTGIGYVTQVLAQITQARPLRTNLPIPGIYSAYGPNRRPGPKKTIDIVTKDPRSPL